MRIKEKSPSECTYTHTQTQPYNHLKLCICIRPNTYVYRRFNHYSRKPTSVFYLLKTPFPVAYSPPLCVYHDLRERPFLCVCVIGCLHIPRRVHASITYKYCSKNVRGLIYLKTNKNLQPMQDFST